MKLFEAGKIGTLALKNRIIMSAMGLGGMTEADGNWTDRMREFYVTRARGGVGLITTGLTYVSQKLEPSSKVRLNLYSDRHLDSVRRTVEEVHSYGAKFCVQLTAGFGRVIPVRLQRPGIAPVSASINPCFFNPDTLTRALATEEVQELAQDFGAAARRCQMAGVDAVEMHGHKGYLMDQLMSAIWNHRTDRYGGSAEARLNFAREVIAEIKAQAGPTFPVIYRIGIDHHLEGGRTPDESLFIVRQLELTGIDALHVDAGSYEASWWSNPPTYQPPGCVVDMARLVKGVVKIPVITVGKLAEPQIAESVLQGKYADFVAIGRGLLTDPEWPNKVKEGRFDEIRPCIGDHEACRHRRDAGAGGSLCSVNPACGYEKEWSLRPIKNIGKKTVLVVGGGPAGMEAARVAAVRGFEVVLWEKAASLGGNLRAAAVLDFKRDLASFLQYQVRQLQKLPVALELNKEATADDILKTGIQDVIVATGADAILPNMGPNLYSAIDVLLNKAPVKRTVLIIGGGLVGCETAVYLAKRGAQVTIVEQLADILNNVPDANRGMLLEMMKASGVQVFKSTRPVSLTNSGMAVDQSGQERVLKAESIVVAAGMQPRDQLRQALAGKVARVYAIGDCVQPGHILDAVWQGFQTARTLQIP